MVTGGKRNKDLLLTADDIGCTDNTQSDDGDKKRKSEDHVEDDKFTDTIVSLSNGIDVKGVVTEPCCNEEANGQVTVKSSCLAEHFAMTMSFLLAEKAGAGAGIDLGSLNSLRCTQVNLQLCRILVQNFDVSHRCINIHGRNLRITKADLGRIMHVTNRGLDVELEGNIEDLHILDLKRRISGNTDITIHGLRRVLIESEHVDCTFRSCLALYAMAIVLSPVTGMDVDLRYLIPVKDSKYLCHAPTHKFYLIY